MQKTKNFLKRTFLAPAIQLYSLPRYFFQTTRETKVLGTFFVRLEQLNPKNQKFLKTDVPSARYSIV